MNKTHADTHWSPNENVTTNANEETSRIFTPSGTAMITGQFQTAPTGWICPKCGRGLAPHTSYCPCYMEKSTVIYRAGDNGLCLTNAPNGEDWIATNAATNH